MRTNTTFVLTDEHRIKANELFAFLTKITSIKKSTVLRSGKGKCKTMPYKVVFAASFKMLYPKVPLKCIAELLGGVHHSSILYYFRMFNDAYSLQIDKKKFHKEIRKLFSATKQHFSFQKRKLILQIDGRYRLSKKEEYQADCIFKLISKITNFSREEIVSKKRTNELVRTRIAFQTLFHYFFPEVTHRCIGELLGGRDHTTSRWYKNLHFSCVFGKDKHNDFAREYRKLLYQLILKLSINMSVKEFIEGKKIAA